MSRFSWDEKTNPHDLEYMSEVDAALRRTGSRWTFWLSGGIVLLFSVFVIWAYFIKLDEATKAMGQVIPSQGVQLIQNQEGGTVLEMAVHETQVVEPGQLLAKIDTVSIASSIRDLMNKKFEHEAALIRLSAESLGTEPVFPQDMIDRYPQAVNGQLQFYQSRKEQFHGEDLTLKEQIVQRRDELVGLLSQKRQLEESLIIIKQQEADVLPLYRRGSYSKMDYLNLMQRIVGMEGELEQVGQNISRAQSAISEAEEHLNNKSSERQAAIADEIAKRRTELNSINQQLAAGGSRATRADMRAPMKGIIKRILIKQGGVARAGETIMELLPIEDTLEVEARIKPTDIGFLRIGQKAVVKVSAYDSNIYGSLDAVLIQISADTIEDKRGESFYIARLRTDKSTLVHEGKVLPIIPGMTVTVDILTGKKSVLDYLLKPLIKSQLPVFKEQ